MANEEALAHLTAAETNQLDSLSHIRSAKVLLGGEVVEPGPGPGPGPGPSPGVYELKTIGKNWKLEGQVANWNDALVFPPMENLAGFTAAEILMSIEVGPKFDGLRNFIYLVENSRRWKGDVVLLVNRGDQGAMAVSNTLAGPETTPVRAAWPLQSGVIQVKAVLAGGIWTVTSGHAAVTMPTPALESTRLVLQLGNSKTDGADHPVNEGWRLLTLTGSVS